MKNYIVTQSTLTGTMDIPTSKSQSIRAILFATLASGTSTIKHYLHSTDIEAMITACCQLGAHIERDQEQLIITGVNGSPRTPDDIIDAGNSGLVLRFIACIAGLQDNHIVITGDCSIRHNRTVLPLIEALPKLGVSCESLRGDNHAPLILKGPFKYHKTTFDGQTSQPVSGLLIAAAFKSGSTHFLVRNPGEKPWVDLTLRWLDQFNISYQHQNHQHYVISGDNHIDAFTYKRSW